jgi:roadblock/LC7 domain-containing protein
MSIVPELAAMDGVIAAGEYSYRGDRFTCEGQMTDEMARMASIMCRATTMAVHMQMDMVKNLGYNCGCTPAQGWVVNGEQFSVCVIANHFCFIQNDQTSLNTIVSYMREKVPDQEKQMV